MKLIIALIFCVLIIPAQAAETPIKFYISGDESTATVLESATVSQDINIFYPGVYNEVLELAWNRNLDLVTGYRVYFGNDITATTQTREVLELPETDPATRISTKFNVANDLGAVPGQELCFRLTAFNDSGMSGYSRAVCTRYALISNVSLYIDDEAMSGAPVMTAAAFPLDYPLKISSLSDGSHSVTTLVTFDDNTTAKRTAFFLASKPKPVAPASLTIKITPLF